MIVYIANEKQTSIKESEFYYNVIYVENGSDNIYSLITFSFYGQVRDPKRFHIYFDGYTT